MNDWYQQFVRSSVGGQLAKSLGLPKPVRLRRYTPGDPLVDGPALLGAGRDGSVEESLRVALEAGGVTVGSADDGERAYAALVFDATGITDVGALTELRTFLSGTLRRVTPCGRVIVLGTAPEEHAEPEAVAACRALDGFVRSLGKEMRSGATANLLYVGADAAPAVPPVVEFLLSGRSAYVSGQVMRIAPASVSEPDDGTTPLDGRVAVVTGAAQGIGAAIAKTLARDGARVVCLDIPAQGERLSTVANEVGGVSVQLDITADDAPHRLVGQLRDRYGSVDVLVHNAGITRDKLLANMDAERWQSVLGVNLEAQLRINGAVLDADLLRSPGRVVCVSSINGIAGARGQTNYAASKAGIVGMVHAMAPRFGTAGSTINAVAPGFIETDMTAGMPLVPREFGRRMNSMGQGGLPIDVAEAVAWFAQPGSGGLNGQVLRVCGQAMVGA